MLVKAEELDAKIVVPKTPMGDGSFAFIAALDGSLIRLQNLQPLIFERKIYHEYPR